MIAIGSEEITGLYFGSQEVSSVYIGYELVYGGYKEADAVIE